MTEKRYTRNPDVTEREVDDAVFLVGADNETLFHLNTLGSALWRLLDEPVSAGEAAQVIHDAFPDVDKAAIESDIVDLISDLDANGLLISGE